MEYVSVLHRFYSSLEFSCGLWFLVNIDYWTRYSKYLLEQWNPSEQSLLPLNVFHMQTIVVGEDSNHLQIVAIFSLLFSFWAFPSQFQHSGKFYAYYSLQIHLVGTIVHIVLSSTCLASGLYCNEGSWNLRDTLPLAAICYSLCTVQYIHCFLGCSKSVLTCPGSVGKRVGRGKK